MFPSTLNLRSITPAAFFERLSASGIRVPELPETETIARDLDREIRGRTIIRVEVRRADVLRDVTPVELENRLTGARITRCWRRAKLVVLDLSTSDRIVVQPRFTGALLVSLGALPASEAAYSTLHLSLDDGRDLHYRDIRRLGTVALMGPERFEKYVGALGVEPLDPAFTAAHLSGILRASRQAVKKVLMDQRVLVKGMHWARELLHTRALAPYFEADSLPGPDVHSEDEWLSYGPCCGSCMWRA